MACLALLSWACKENHVNPTLIVTIVDKGGAAVAGAQVNLYASTSDYDNNVIKESFTTGADGRISSTKEEYSSGVFYIDATKGDFIIWPVSSIKGGTNDYKLTLGDNNYYKDLVGPHWVLSDVLIANQSVFANVSPCSKDNYLLFKKNLSFEANEGALLCSGMIQSIAGTYVPTAKDASALAASGNVLVYPLGSSSLGSLAISSTLDRITLTAGTTVNVYRKP